MTDDPKDCIAAAHLAKPEGVPSAQPDPDVMGWLEGRFGVDAHLDEWSDPPTYRVILQHTYLTFIAPTEGGLWKWRASSPPKPGATGEGTASTLQSAASAAASAAIEALETDLARLRPAD